VQLVFQLAQSAFRMHYIAPLALKKMIRQQGFNRGTLFAEALRLIIQGLGHNYPTVAVRS